MKNVLLTGSASGSLGTNANIKVNGSNVTESGSISPTVSTVASTVSITPSGRKVSAKS